MGPSEVEAPPPGRLVAGFEDDPEQLARIALAVGALRAHLGRVLWRFRPESAGAAFVGAELGALRLIEARLLRELPAEVVADVRARLGAIQEVLSPSRPGPPGLGRRR